MNVAAFDMAGLNDELRAIHRASGDSGPVPYALHTAAPSPAPVPSPEPPGAPSDVIHVCKYSPPNWWSPEGVAKKRRIIERRGLPDFHSWRFVTLTLNRELFDGPLDGYLVGKDHMRRFMVAARLACLWAKTARWCWKLEFQADGWPHWHLLVERTEKMSVEEMETLGKLWALGRTNVEMVSSGEFLYSFKYAFKPVMQDEENAEAFLDDEPQAVLPGWFQDYYEPSTDDGKPPKSFARCRFWQTSRGFYTSAAESPPKEEKPKLKSFVPWRVRDVADRAGKLAQVVARDARGNSILSAVVAVGVGFSGLMGSAAWQAACGGAVFFGADDFVCPVHVVKNQVETSDRWKLQQVLEKTRLRLGRAVRLRDRGEKLKTYCSRRTSGPACAA